MLQRATAYLDEGDVPGWLDKGAAELLLHLATEMNLDGRPVCEIGVHHGKTAILLGLLTGGRLVGYDLFDRQDENVDRSGRGSRRAFVRNAARYGIERERLLAIEANSSDLSADDILHSCAGNPVIFSVDGGHTEDCTYNDLCLAADTVAADGIVMLDDFFNKLFPEVCMGAMRFMSDRRGDLVPFCLGGGKVFFAKDEAYAAKYFDHVSAWSAGSHAYHDSTCRFFGYATCVMATWKPPERAKDYLVRTRLWLRLRDTRTGMIMRKLVRG